MHVPKTKSTLTGTISHLPEMILFSNYVMKTVVAMVTAGALEQVLSIQGSRFGKKESMTIKYMFTWGGGRQATITLLPPMAGSPNFGEQRRPERSAASDIEKRSQGRINSW